MVDIGRRTGEDYSKQQSTVDYDCGFNSCETTNKCESESVAERTDP